MYYTRKSKAQLHPLILSVILFMLIIPTSTIVTNTSLVSGQTNQTISDNADLLNIQDIPAKKVHVGDIDIAYKIFGKGDPILLISPAQGDMNLWNHTKAFGQKTYYVVDFGLTAFYSCTVKIRQILQKVY